MLIKINTGGSAFHAPEARDEMLDRYILSSELDRLFRQIYSDIRHGAKTEGSLIDVNGNKVGCWSLEEKYECRHGGEDGERVCACDYDSKTDSCNFNPAKGTSDIDIERQLNMLHRDGYFDAEQIIRSLLRKIEISDLCEDENGTIPLVENLRAYVELYRSGETLNRKIRETEDVMEDAADVIEYLMKKAGIKKLELKFLKNFAQELRYDTKIFRNQLRSLWTAYCLHNNLEVDTMTYDRDILELWSVVSLGEKDTAAWSDFDSFDDFMYAQLV